jgi:imidazolonepropionase
MAKAMSLRKQAARATHLRKHATAKATPRRPVAAEALPLRRQAARAMQPRRKLASTVGQSKSGDSRSTRGLLLLNVRQLLTLRSSNDGPRRGSALSDLGIIEDAAVLCIGGKIVSVGKTSQALRDPWLKANRKKLHEIDCTDKVVLPAFVDSHTHPAFTAPRLVDFEKRISGASYEQIAEAGGGIRSSLQGVRKATREQLAAKVSKALQQMALHGTGTVEAKSGYGLSVEAEMKSLLAIKDAANSWPGTVTSTLLGAHVVPPEFKGRSQEYVESVCQQMFPRAAKRKLADFIDVFCDRGAFSPEEAHQILDAALKHKLRVRAHVCQLTPCSLQLFLDYQPSSLDHLDHVSDGDVQLLSKTNTVATLVPGANYFLGLEQYPPARKLIVAGAAVALATDYNPGTSPTPSMPFVLSLACTHMKMSPQETIAAATINGAWAVNLSHCKGSIESGKDADLAIFDVSDYREISYWFGVNRCVGTILRGELQADQPTKNLA